VSRYAWTTLIAIALASVVALTLPDPKRGWIVVGIWLIYLPLFACGIILIQMNFFTRAICHAKAGGMKVALTFDDGPDPASTPALLDWLAQHQIPATFFCIGRNVEANPELTARIVTDGHLIGNHSYHHPWFISLLWNPWLARELIRAQNAIQRATGVTPKYFRPPSGTTSPHFPRALRNTALTLIGWDVRSLDTVGTADQAITRIRRLTSDGSIIVLHDGGSSPERLLKIVSTAVKELRSRGFEFERLDRLIETPATELNLT
jgi:peptidoglycan/xylan/chitin deacetylase (PgdA/CDA1 family)